MEFFIFWIAAAIGGIAIVPYQMKMMGSKIEEQAKETGKKVPPKAVLILLGIVQTSILMGVAAYVGTLLAPKVDLHWYLLDSLLDGASIPFSLSNAILIAISGALILTLVMLVLDMQIMKKIPQADIDYPSKAQSLLASLYGGISEEVLTRLFVMTGVVWLLSFTAIGNLAYWIGIVVAAILFGVLHLPAAFGLFGKSGIVIFRTILLNALPGLLFGYLYWTFGIEIAMISHFFADIFLHVVFGPIFRTKLTNQKAA